MAAVIEIGGKKATIDNETWTCEDKSLEGILVAYTKSFLASGEIVYSPNPDRDLAQACADYFGGKVVSFDEVESVEGRVY